MVAPAVGIISKFKWLLSNGFMVFVVVVLLVDSIMIGVEQKSYVVGLKELGGHLANPMLDLKEASENLIIGHNQYDPNASFITNYWPQILTFGNMLSCLWIIGAWIFIFAWLFERTVSDSTAVFRNYFLAIIIYVAIQIIYMLVFTEYDKVATLTLPYDTAKAVINAIPYIVKPTKHVFDIAKNNSIVSNITTYTP